MKYFVTGSSGFIGGNLVRFLQHQHEIIPYDLKDNSGDIRDYEALLNKMQDADGVFHLAAIASVQESINDPERTFQTNVIGTQNVFAAAKHLGGIPVVYASSAAIYGDNQNLPLNEAETPKPLSPYAEHKLKNERDAQEYGLKTFGLRFFNVYGPGQDPSSPYSGVISVFYDRLKKRKNLRIFGDGKQTRDFVAAGDVVQALIKAINYVSKDAPVANVCTGSSSTLLQLAENLGAALGNSTEITHEQARLGDIRHSLGSPEHFEALTGFRPTTSLAEGLKRLIEGS